MAEIAQFRLGDRKYVSLHLGGAYPAGENADGTWDIYYDKEGSGLPLKLVAQCGPGHSPAEWIKIHGR